MKKLSKKSSSAASSNDDPNRNALFGSRGGGSGSSSRSSPAPNPRYQNDPYASRQDPYANPRSDPYAQRGDPYAQREGSYSGQRSDPYAQQRQDPYARDPYASRGSQSQPPPPQQSQQRPPVGARGYSNESQDSARNALFGNRPQPPPQSDPYGARSGGGGGYGGYDAEPDRYSEYQQQAEGDEEDVEAIKQEIRFVKQDSLASTRNAIRIGLEAEEQGRNSLARLGTQSETLSSVERSLDVSAAHARIAEDKARELKKLNRSMFAVHVSNPFTSKSRAEEEERKIMERHELEREEREKVRRDVYDSAQRVNGALNQNTGRGNKAPPKSSITSRSQYMFEEDEEDVQVEKDIDSNLNTLGDITARLKGLALATQAEIKAQNEKLDTITNKVRLPFEVVLMVRVIISTLLFISTRNDWRGSNSVGLV
jgi:protein transport protein SEC9